ncbi:response regulator [Pseudanabaena sp. PCC 6802]|uniref:response regulator n=1 Tax=Pseudanabaena sp. PCC 6802 TaxID=118173 RepID=UPI000344D46A|nr:response regulator [Pseudanabaena sp. PCC 6802]
MTAQKILVIDDSIMIRKTVKNILAGMYEVLEANDGKTGLDIARRSNPDLILLDFVMPKYNGYQTLQAIRRFDNLKDTPVIMISGLKEQVAEHVPEPFVGFEFLEKPFEADTLIGMIQRLLPTKASPAPGPSLEEGQLEGQSSSQMLMAKLTATESMLTQGIEQLIQKEVVARVVDLHSIIQKQENTISQLDQKVDKLTRQLDYQSKGMMVLLKEIRSLQATLASKQ